MVVQDLEETPGHTVLTPGGITDVSLVIARMTEQHPYIQCELVSESIFGLISQRPADWQAQLLSRTVPVFTAANDQFDRSKTFAVSCELVPVIAVRPAPNVRDWADGARIKELERPLIKAELLKAVQCWGQTQNLPDDCMALQHLRRMLRYQVPKLTWHRSSSPVGVLRGWSEAEQRNESVEQAARS